MTPTSHGVLRHQQAETREVFRRVKGGTEARGKRHSLLALQMGSSASSAGADTKIPIWRAALKPDSTITQEPREQGDQWVLGVLTPQHAAPCQETAIRKPGAPEELEVANTALLCSSPAPCGWAEARPAPLLPPSPSTQPKPTAALPQTPHRIPGQSHPPPPHHAAPGEVHGHHTHLTLISGANWVTPPSQEGSLPRCPPSSHRSSSIHPLSAAQQRWGQGKSFSSNHHAPGKN